METILNGLLCFLLGMVVATTILDFYIIRPLKQMHQDAIAGWKELLKKHIETKMSLRKYEKYGIKSPIKTK